MRILVTGGAGFIASHIVDAYVSDGHQVSVIDDLSTGNKRHLNPKASFYAASILDPSLPELLAEISPDVVNHHAAQIDLRLSVTDPVLDARINILGLIRLLESCKNMNVKKVIFASSGGAIYGEQRTFPAPEDHPTQPASPYGISKLTGEYYLAYYKSTFGIPYVALRYANVYGPRQCGTGEAGVIAIFLEQLLGGRSPTINGDGKQTRDYVYVADVVDANRLALESSYAGPLNIGTARETDVVTLFRMLRDNLGLSMEPVHGPAKAGEQRRSCVDNARAAGVLGWSPRVPLSEGVEKTIAYFKEAKSS